MQAIKLCYTKKFGYPYKVGQKKGCHFERSEKNLESAVCGFKGFLASLEMTEFAWVANILNISVSNLMWVANNSK